MKKERTKSILDYLPNKHKPTRLFQANIDVDILKLVIEQRDKDGLNWRELIEACFRKYLDEKSEKKAG